MMEPINNLTFGVELEVILPRGHTDDQGRAELAAMMCEEGAECASETYNHRTRQHWKIVTDATIGHENAEVVSPILQGDDGFDQIKRVCRAMERFGCRVNRQTGFHVHVGVGQFGHQIGFFKELVRTYAKFEPIIDQLVSRSRRGNNNQWCRPIRFTPEIDQAATLRDLRYAYGGNRYHKVNLEAFTVHGTVEFRQHQGTTNAEKITRWVTLCLRMVEHAAKNTELEGGEAPPRVPRLPPEPVFETTRDLSTAPRINAEQIREARYHSRGWVIRSIAQPNPILRPGPRQENWRHYHVGETIRQYRMRGGSLNHLRWDVERGRVVVVDSTAALPVAMVPNSDEWIRQEAARTAWRTDCERITAEHERAVAAHNAGRPAATRPATDAAPVSLDGLLALIGASDAELMYFSERQVELNQ